MDLVHESGPWTRSKEGVHGPLVHVLSGWQKAWRYVKVFTFVFLSQWRSLRTKKIAPIILHSKTILRN